MSEKNSFPFDIPELPDSVDNALKNLSDAPTKSIGQTLSDAWFLVFGGISHQANKRRMKYAHDLEIYNYELSRQLLMSLPKTLLSRIFKQLLKHLKILNTVSNQKNFEKCL